MTKNELIAAVADTAKLTKTSAASAVDATFDIITGALYEKDTAGVYDKILSGG